MVQGGLIRVSVGLLLFFFFVVGQAIGDIQVKRDRTPPSTLKTDNPKSLLADLETLASSAEDIYNLARANKWNKIAKKLEELKKTETTLSLFSGEENNYYSDRLRKRIDDLEKAVVAKNRREAMRSSNRITLIDVAMMGQFKLRVPREIMVLDYCGREIEILSEEKDIDKLSNLVLRMHLVWQNLIPQLLQKNATREIKSFSEIMKRLESAKTPEEFNRSAKQVLNEVDDLEKVFLR